MHEPFFGPVKDIFEPSGFTRGGGGTKIPTPWKLVKDFSLIVSATPPMNIGDKPRLSVGEQETQDVHALP